MQNQLRPESDPRHLAAKIQEMLNGVIHHVREDVAKVSEPKTEALFETTAEVPGLLTAYDHYERRSEQACR